MPRHERAPSGHDEPRLNRTRDEMMADFREEMKAKHRHRVVDYFAGATPEQLAMLPRDWRRAGSKRRA